MDIRYGFCLGSEMRLRTKNLSASTRDTAAIGTPNTVHIKLVMELNLSSLSVSKIFKARSNVIRSSSFFVPGGGTKSIFCSPIPSSGN